MSAGELTLSPTLEVAIAKLELRPADILVVKLDLVLNADIAIRVRSSFEALRTDGGKVVVIDKGTDLSVIGGS